jgi:hypothetical protein
VISGNCSAKRTNDKSCLLESYSLQNNRGGYSVERHSE